MRIAACVKQVPGSSKVEVDPKTGVLKRDGVDSKMNPYDLYALESALRMKELLGGSATVTAITMGPPQSEEILREAFMMGVDEGVLISDRRFAGADVLATSWTLSQGLRKLGGFDLIVCGKQTTDGDTAQVGAELAEFLGIPHLCNVLKINSLSESEASLELDLPQHVQSLKIKLPCLITVEKGIFEPRLPSFKRKKATAGKEVLKLKLDDLPDRDERRYGLNGSPTNVWRIFPPESHVERELWEGSGSEIARKAACLLRDRKFLQQAR